jgi:hypothetical protein
MTSMAEMGTNGEELRRPSKSGQQAGAENVECLRAYIDHLKTTRGRLPSHKGKPDKSAIATACGFDRQTFYNNPEAKALLDKAVKEIGVGGSPPQVGGRTEHLEQLMTTRDRRIQHLEERLQSRTVEVEDLRRENKKLKERLRQYEIADELMTTTGRKYRP